MHRPSSFVNLVSTVWRPSVSESESAWAADDVGVPSTLAFSIAIGSRSCAVDETRIKMDNFGGGLQRFGKRRENRPNRLSACTGKSHILLTPRATGCRQHPARGRARTQVVAQLEEVIHVVVDGQDQALAGARSPLEHQLCQERLFGRAAVRLQASHGGVGDPRTWQFVRS